LYDLDLPIRLKTTSRVSMLDLCLFAPERTRMLRQRFRFAALAALALGLAAPASAQLTASLVVGGLTRPLGFVQDPSDPTVQIILQKDGLALVLKNGVLQPTPFLDLTSPGTISTASEGGLLGLAFAPDYAASGRAYVSFTNAQRHTVIARFLRHASDPLVLDATTRFDFVWPDGNAFITHPALCSATVCGNHNGGNLAFGPDGYLYIGLGDGGGGSDPLHLAQNPQSLLGKILRLEVAVPLSDAQGYDVPPTNPFVGLPVLPEIWAFGLRNPWRWSFDYPRAGSTGALIIGDVGQGQREEIDYQPLGVAALNYGWRNREGALAYLGSLPPYYTPLRDPLFDYDRNTGSSITGGFVYRGQALGSTYRGRYFFADFGSGRVWSMALTIDPMTGEATAGGVWDHSVELGAAASTVSSFGVDAAGELYTVRYGGSVGTGAIYRIGLAGPPPAGTCTALDPYLAVGGGLCFQGQWLSRARGSDMSGDNRPDLLFANASKQLYAWFMDGKNRVGGTFLTPGQIAASRIVAGMSDFTGDGKPDLVVQDQTTGALSIFIMNGTTLSSEQVIPVAAGIPWRVVATGDFDGDSHADLLWTLPSTGQFYIWFMQPSGGAAGFGGPGGAFRGGFVADGVGSQVVLSASWRIVGTGDTNADGTADVFRQNDTTGALALWSMNGVTVMTDTSLAPGSVAPAWKIRAVADYNGDQHVDLAWEHQTSGDLYLWFLIDKRLARGTFMTPSRVNPTWQITAPK
jgi:glucose/arabinose dehydrogenase